MTIGPRTRRSRPASATLTIPAYAARAVRSAEGLRLEFRRRAGLLEFRIDGSTWTPIDAIEEAVAVRRGPVQLAALGADEESFE